MILPVYFDHLLLADTVTSSLSLEVVLRVPVAVIDDNCVGCCQIDPQAASFRAEQEHESIRVRFAKPVNSCLTQVSSNTTIKSFVWIFS